MVAADDDTALLARLSEQVSQAAAELLRWRQQEEQVAAQLDTAISRLQQHTVAHRGDVSPPRADPALHIAVNNHATAVNGIRARIDEVKQRKDGLEKDRAAVVARLALEGGGGGDGGDGGGDGDGGDGDGGAAEGKVKAEPGGKQ